MSTTPSLSDIEQLVKNMDSTIAANEEQILLSAAQQYAPHKERGGNGKDVFPCVISQQLPERRFSGNTDLQLGNEVVPDESVINAINVFLSKEGLGLCLEVIDQRPVFVFRKKTINGSTTPKPPHFKTNASRKLGDLIEH